VHSRLSSRSGRCALGGSLREEAAWRRELLPFAVPGRRVIAVAGVRSRKATLHNGRSGPCLTTGCSGRRCAPPLNRNVGRPELSSVKRTGATLSGQLLITFVSSGALGILACMYQAATLHALFPGGFITYGEFLKPENAHLRTQAIVIPLCVTTGVFLVTGLLSRGRLLVSEHAGFCSCSGFCSRWRSCHSSSTTLSVPFRVTLPSSFRRAANKRLQRTACRHLLLFSSRSARGTQPVNRRDVGRQMAGRVSI
jgi:hypothetical protein